MSTGARRNPPHRLEIRRVFHARREKVFAAWTQREQLEQWMCKDEPTHEAKYVELDVRPGGRYVIEIRLPNGDLYRGQGIFRVVNAPEKLVFTWFWQRVPEKEGEVPLQRDESLVTVELFERGSTTEMVVTHEFIESAKHLDDNKRGWEGCFEILARLLEGRK
jgi:uncharacterized protein YndB with AHSA1/START domain